jgi:hypothetical protein
MAKETPPPPELSIFNISSGMTGGADGTNPEVSDVYISV